MSAIKELIVLLEGRKVGVLREEASGRHTFTYDLSSSDVAQLSLAMPRRVEPWRGNAVEAYIDGILPDDSSVRQRIARLYSVNARNPFALLTAIGLDCGGAVQFVAPGTETGKMVEVLTPINEEQIGQRLESVTGAAQASWQNNGEHWSLNGAQDKLALRYTNNQWYEAEGAAATTHIIKPGIRGLREQAFNEYLCLTTARKIGLSVARSDYRVFGNVPAIVSARWDRRIDDSTMPATVTRIHQEDFCQAMGVMTNQKYQSDGGPSPQDIVRFMRAHGFLEEDVKAFFAALIFNYLIAGSDAHAKNYAILEIPGKVPRLAPLYDIASLFAYDTQRKDRKLAMSIGGEYNWERIELRNWRKLAEQCGNDSWSVIAPMLLDISLRILPAFDEAAKDALAWSGMLPHCTVESQQNKMLLIGRIREGIVAQSVRTLDWFAAEQIG
ncbi:type II toxin-antitoxin system HipA family toxin [Bifidobacterium callitrichidarum]|uniref:Type II toxin-antitoxin system HipA family toxin n=1 Tax=Bifidobacterium callitrichidarum TaxID=2052941 RepID=A0A2U2N1Z2_9BIFI|nr:type II toxin-antitoxin system HipA family toxin [Bifidobacterium callitrichidarum]PWG63068.1 type II toxin-antitoxin system HipA family toxin [Bifidobacterium callitrichidarum]